MLTLPSSATLRLDERLFLSGLLAGPRRQPARRSDTHASPVTPLSAGNRAWVDGVLAGIFSRTERPAAPHRHRAEPPPKRDATVVWASQTGTVEEYAQTCAEQLSQTGFSVRLRGAEEVSITDLSGTVLFVVATTGDGDPPDNGIALWDALAAAEPGDLDDLEFTVLGFGDSSYADFCGFARKLDARLEHLGARRIIDRALCEPDFEETARAWTGQVTAFLGSPESGQTETKPAASHRYSRRNPLRTTITRNAALCGAGSDKDVRNVGVHLPDGTLEYGVGRLAWVYGHTTGSTRLPSSSSSPAWMVPSRSHSATIRCRSQRLSNCAWTSPGSLPISCVSYTNAARPTTYKPQSTIPRTSPSGSGASRPSTCWAATRSPRNSTNGSTYSDR